MADSADVIKPFDAYEVIAVIIPGSVLAIMAMIDRPGLRTLLGGQEFGVGDFGLFVLAAFILGHLVQGLGELLEYVIWWPGRLPTYWLRYPERCGRVADPGQRQAFVKALEALEGHEIDAAETADRDWHNMIGKASGRVRASTRANRLVIAGRTYGLSRGLAAAFLLCLVWSAVFHWRECGRLAFLSVCFAAAVWRTQSSGVGYARALVQDFPNLPPEAPAAVET